jgi:two-component system OmpR family sensor kinase
VSLRLRLTLLTTLIVVLTTSALGTAIYVATARIQLDRIDARLYADISEARVRSLQDNPRPPQDGVYVDTALGRVNRDGVTIKQLRAAGTAEEPIPLPSLSAGDIAAATVAPITVNDGTDFRVAVRSHGSGLATVVAAAPLNVLQENLAQLARAIILLGLGFAVIGALASWITVRRAFRPVDAMVGAASAIAAGDTDRRLPPARPGTEIGDLTGAMNVMIDSLAEAVARVERSEDQLRAFLSDASHEIRTPLTVIRGYAELLVRQGGGLSDAERQSLGRIESESQRLDRLVTRLLSLERSTAPHRGPQSRVDVAALVLECAGDLATLDPAREVSTDVAAATVTGDTDALRQLLANGVQNVLRHTPNGSPVSFSAQRQDNRVVVCIDDAGPGIPAERLESIAAGRRTSSSADGFGLGMAIMEAVAVQHGGELTLLSSPLGGLRLRIDLPAAST